MKRKWAKYAGAAIGAANTGYSYYKRARTAYNFAKALTGKGKRVKPAYRFNGSRTLTKQHDVGVSKPGGLSRRKKQKLRWIKKVQHAAAQNDITHFYTECLNGELTVAAVQAGPSFQQVLKTDTATTQYDLRIGLFDPSRQIPAYVQDVINQATTATGGAETYNDIEAIKYSVTLQQCTINIRNSTDVPSGGHTAADAEPIFVDIYECVAVKDIHNSSEWRTAQATWKTCLEDYSETTTLDDSSTTIPYNQAGLTPFNCHNFRHYWKVLKKTRTYLGVGDHVNYSYSTKKYTTTIESNEIACHKGITKDLIIVANPTYSGIDDAAFTPISVQWTKRFNFKVPDSGGIQQSFRAGRRF